jgi:hypothetical protein
MPTNYYVKEIVLSTIVATIISYYYFINKPNNPSVGLTSVGSTSVGSTSVGLTTVQLNCEPNNYCR